MFFLELAYNLVCVGWCSYSSTVCLLLSNDVAVLTHVITRKLISKVRNVLEAQLPRTHPHTEEPRIPAADRITIRTDARQFESFLRSINRCSSLLDARRLKNDVMGEIRRTRALLGV